MGEFLSSFISLFGPKPVCGHARQKAVFEGTGKVAIVGSPNVGKSVIFHCLTGQYVNVSNYPGTTVEVTRGTGRFGAKEYAVIDTPGMYSLLPITEEESVARSILLEENPLAVIQVVDAKNLEKMLPFTFQLLEANVPLILNLNMMDESERLGMRIDRGRLQEALGIPVVETVATRGENIDGLKKTIVSYRSALREKQAVFYGKEIEESLEKIEALLQTTYKLSKRAVSMLLLLEDKEIHEVVVRTEKENYSKIRQITAELKAKYSHPLNYIIAVERQRAATGLCAKTIFAGSRPPSTFQDKLSWLTMNPLTGFPVFCLILYGLYEFVGVFGSQVSVNFVEEVVFGRYINPFMTRVVESAIPWGIAQDLLVHDYGIITLGIRYAVAIILPIVTTFFIAFAVIEDTGYLPRLAMLIDRVFKKIGLNGRAVIPIVLGFGCDTMATLVTRTLETKRERVIATLLLALAVPCSAQLGVILALLAGNPTALWIWVSVMALIFIFIGYLAAQILPGEKPLFYMEVPPLRWPKPSNILTKTYTRVEWYFKEIMPLFIWASVFIWIGHLTKLFHWLVSWMEYPVRWIGLPRESAMAFFFGFFRRDYGAAGLYDLKKAGVLSGNMLLVAVVTMALFMPCIAQFAINIKERGLKTALWIGVFIFPFAFLVGGLVNLALVLLGVKL